MRLINVETEKFEEFVVSSSDTLKYAILSHTWDDDGEATFQDFKDPGLHLANKKGFDKIRTTCSLAKKDNIPYVWVDTCCIDKTSSAELMEAINSMFNWYRDAQVCYVWLADLPAATEESINSSLKQCRWFTRGWTLQELLAPRDMKFYDRDWEFRGTKRDLQELIADAAQIRADVLERPEGIHRLSIAQRMSWAARRKTTRPEDMAYCLLGLFGVNMPMLYGEGGTRAFIRLQDRRSRAHERCNKTVMYNWILLGQPRQKMIYIHKWLDAARSVVFEVSHRHAFVLRRNCNIELYDDGTNKELSAMSSFIVQVKDYPKFPFAVKRIGPVVNWDAARKTFYTHDVDHFVGSALFSPYPEDFIGAVNADYAVKPKKGQSFLVIFGPKPGEDRPWIMVKDEGKEYLLAAAHNSVFLREPLPPSGLGSSSGMIKHRGSWLKITATLEEGELDGQCVYYIDLDVEYVLEPSPDTQGGPPRSNDAYKNSTREIGRLGI